MENSFSPMSLARPSVAATLPAVSDASDVASTPRMSPWTAICWPFLSTRKTILELESTCSRWRVSLICWYSSSYITRSGDAIVLHHLPVDGNANVLNLPSPFQRFRHRDLVGVLEIAADGEPERQSRGAHLDRPELLGDVERRRFALDVRVRGHDDFAHAAAAHALQQSVDVDVLRPDALERRERAEEDVEEALEIARPLDRGNVERFLDDADDRGVAPRVGADRARVDVGHVVARRAVEDLLLDLDDRARQRLGLGGGTLEDMVGEARGRLAADAGELRQLVDEVGQRRRGQNSPGIFIPPVIAPRFFDISSSTLREASLTAATTRSCSISTSFGSTTSFSMATARSSLEPFMVALTMPPPAEPSTRSAAIWACICACICCTCCIIFFGFIGSPNAFRIRRSRRRGASGRP